MAKSQTRILFTSGSIILIQVALASCSTASTGRNSVSTTSLPPPPPPRQDLRRNNEATVTVTVDPAKQEDLEKERNQKRPPPPPPPPPPPRPLNSQLRLPRQSQQVLQQDELSQLRPETKFPDDKTVQSTSSPKNQVTNRQVLATLHTNSSPDPALHMTDHYLPKPNMPPWSEIKDADRIQRKTKVTETPPPNEQFQYDRPYVRESYEDSTLRKTAAPLATPLHSAPPSTQRLDLRSRPIEQLERIPNRIHTHTKSREPALKSFQWKSIWSKIEKGLDDLANLEDTVTNRAKYMYSMAAAVVGNKSGVSIGKIANGKILSKASPKITPPSVLTKRLNAPSNPYQIHQKALKKGGPISSDSSSLSPRKIDWNRVGYAEATPSLIRATGGAASPENGGFASKVVTDTSYQGQFQRTFPRDDTHLKKQERDAASTPSPSARPIGSSSVTPTSKIDDKINSRAFWKNARMSLPQVSTTSNARIPRLDNDESSSVFLKLGTLLPNLLLLSRFNPIRRKYSSSDDVSSTTLEAWNVADDKHDRSARSTISTIFGSKRDKIVAAKVKSQMFTSTINNLMERLTDGSLLNSKEKKKCISIGRWKATSDIVVLCSMLACIRILPPFGNMHSPRSIDDFFSVSFPQFLSVLSTAMDTWAPHVFVVALLISRVSYLIGNQSIKSLVDEVDAAVKTETQYAALYLRLSTFMSSERRMPELMRHAAAKQIESKVSTARFHFVVGLTLLVLITATVSFVGPAIAIGLMTIGQLVSFDQWQRRPLEVKAILDGIWSILFPAFEELKVVILEELPLIIGHQQRLVFQASVFIALIAASWLPNLESSRKFAPSLVTNVMDNNMQQQRFMDQLWNLGASGSSRLVLLSVNGRVERALERWCTLSAPYEISTANLSWRSLIRLAGYSISSAIVLASPLCIRAFVPMSTISTPYNSMLQWDKMFDIVAIFVFIYALLWKTFCTSVNATERLEKVQSFITSFINVIDDRKAQLMAPPPDFKLSATITPDAGLIVSDLWAAHASRRAWAVRGANVNCKNGEVLVILGDDGSGRTRLLTAIAEAIVMPPRGSWTTQKVRGSIVVSGLDVSKWEYDRLRRRVGVMLNDARSQSDLSQMMSGLSLEEILDPCDGLIHLVHKRGPGLKERACMTMALKVTGLYSSLLPRLPSKMSTIVTSSEEDVISSARAPRSQLLSPGEWSKLMLAITLTQVMYDNDGVTGTDTVVNSLIGSLLLLDDIALHFSEVEEARLYKDLRQSGAASIVTSNRWASGRFADKILVLKDGAIVESGTHMELLNMGPQQSIYAAKWLAMTNS